MKHLCTMVDDDGVLVVTTAKQMEIWRDRKFSYDFPDELLQLMAERRIVAWECGGEGDHQVSIEVLSSATELGDRFLGPFVLQVDLNDWGIVMPYSQFTYAADCAEGVVESTCSYAFALQRGGYSVWIARTASGFSVQIVRDDPSISTSSLAELPEP